MTSGTTPGGGWSDPLAGAPAADPRDPLARLRWAMEQAERMAARQADSDAREAARTADSARRGELGAEWQRVQQRVDRGETTVADVFSGRDTSPDAVALADRSRAQMGTLLGSVSEPDRAALGEAFDALEEIRDRVAAAIGDAARTVDGSSGREGPAGATGGRPSWFGPA